VCVCVVGNELCHKCDCVSDPIDRVLQVQSSGGRLLKETVRSMQCGRMCVWSFMCGTVVIIASDCDVEPVAEGHRVWGRGRWQRSKQNTHTITHPTHTLPTHTTAHKAAQVTQACRNASKTWLGRNAYAHLLLRRHGQGPARVPGPAVGHFGVPCAPRNKSVCAVLVAPAPCWTQIHQRADTVSG
jgi:hypothetical protein